MIKQTQKSGDFSTNTQAGHIGDKYYNYYFLEQAQLDRQHHEGLELKPNYVAIADRYIDESAMGKFYSLLAKDALVTDITHFDNKAPGSNVIERRTTIRLIGKQGERFPIFLRGYHEPPCAVASPVVVVYATDEDHQLLSIGIWEKGIRWNYYSSLALIKKWKYWRPMEGIIILASCIVLVFLWFLKIHFQFYYEVSSSISSTTVLWSLSSFVAVASLVPVQIREGVIRKRMEEFAQEVSTEVGYPLRAHPTDSGSR
jgi:hypothetical protein